MKRVKFSMKALAVSIAATAVFSPQLISAKCISIPSWPTTSALSSTHVQTDAAVDYRNQEPILINIGSSDVEVTSLAIQSAREFFTARSADAEHMMVHFKPLLHEKQAESIIKTLRERIEVLQKNKFRLDVVKLDESNLVMVEKRNKDNMTAYHITIPMVVKLTSEDTGASANQTFVFGIHLVKQPKTEQNPYGLGIWTIGKEES